VALVRANSEEIVHNLKYLRRYARALMGSQESGDLYVRICLEALLAEPDLLSAGNHVKRGLFQLFHAVSSRHIEGTEGTDLVDLSVEARLGALPASERQILLLTSLEGFSTADAAQILDVPLAEAEALLVDAWSTVNQQIATSILVIEDEPVIALDIASLVTELGHQVVGVAASQAEAVAIFKKTQPGLILADIDLGAGGSGITAVTDILRMSSVPVIFVTAYPERLLTGERPEPTYLVTKPFEPDTLKVTISQALSFTSTGHAKRIAV
jgi:CheY-like chemotaxis protein/DNA-directed RNA polymerase specialized sigma24 family protein